MDFEGKFLCPPGSEPQDKTKSGCGGHSPWAGAGLVLTPLKHRRQREGSTGERGMCCLSQPAPWPAAFIMQTWVRIAELLRNLSGTYSGGEEVQLGNHSPSIAVGHWTPGHRAWAAGAVGWRGPQLARGPGNLSTLLLGKKELLLLISLKTTFSP
jgi:hypothetical protein